MGKGYRWQRGVGIVEVMIALFVMGFGLLSLAMFGNGLFSESGQVKAKTEALQLAQQKLEQYRLAATNNGLATLAAATENAIAGVNTSYSRAATVSFSPSTGAPRYALVNVAVSWTDKSGSQSVSLNSLVSAPDKDALGSLVGKGIDGGGFVNTPLGGASYASGTFTPGADAQNLSASYGVPGSSVYLETPNYILTDADSQKLLISQTEFATVTGRVYIQGGAVDESVIVVKPSDVGVCPKQVKLDGSGAVVRDAGGVPLTEVREVRSVNGEILDLAGGASSDGSLLYTYFTYNCFFGSGWYGNAGLIRTDNFNSNDRMCAGDPAVSDDSTAESRHPQLLGARTYRGYTPQYDLQDIDNDGILTEPAIDGNGNRIYLSDGMAEGDAYGDTSRSSVDFPRTHDFLLTVISGSAVDSDCQPQLQLSGSSEFQNNSGDYICIYDENGNKSCPDVLPEDLGYQVTTTPRYISGVINVGAGDSATVDEFALTTSQAESCTINGDFSWSCTVYDVGAGWTGSITLSSSRLRICSTQTHVFAALGTNVSGYAYNVAASCEPGDTWYLASGVVRNISNGSGIDLSGASVVTAPAGGSCGAALGYLDKAKNGNNEATFACILPANFTGAITLDALPAGARIVSNPDFGASAVSGDLSGLVIEVR